MQIREEEFERAIAGLTKAIEAGFAGTNSRLDKVNGRLDRHDEAIMDLQIERAKQLGREEANADNRPLLTTRDGRLIKMLWAVGAALAAAVAWIVSHWPAKTP